MNDPVIRHLLDILKIASPDCFILGGGLGLNIKRSHLVYHEVPTLVAELPEARATTDIDLFLKLDVFLKSEQGQALRVVLDELQYTVHTAKWRFGKPFDPLLPGAEVFVDLLARLPNEGESVRVRNRRVGSRSHSGLHGRETPEAFAVEAAPLQVDIRNADGIAARVLVPHPYAWINMKVRAAHDWHRYRNHPWPLGQNQKPPSGKHVFDAALIIAMLTEEELAEARDLAATWRTHPIASDIREEAAVLFGEPTARGWLEARRQNMVDDHDLIWSAMREVLGIGR